MKDYRNENALKVLMKWDSIIVRNMQNLLRNIKSIRNKIDNLKKNIHNEFDALVVAKNKNHPKKNLMQVADKSDNVTW